MQFEECEKKTALRRAVRVRTFGRAELVSSYYTSQRTSMLIFSRDCLKFSVRADRPGLSPSKPLLSALKRLRFPSLCAPLPGQLAVVLARNVASEL